MHVKPVPRLVTSYLERVSRMGDVRCRIGSTFVEKILPCLLQTQEPTRALERL